MHLVVDEPVDWGRAAEATAQLLKDAYGIDIYKSLDPLDQDDFLVIVESIAGDLQRVAGPIDAAVVEQAIQALNVDWVALTEAQRAELVHAANTAMRGIPSQVLPQVTAQLKLRLNDVVGNTKVSASIRLGSSVATSLTQVDKETVGAIAHIGQWVTDEYGRRASMVATGANSIISDGLAAGRRATDISSDLAAMGRRVGIDQSANYWRTVALNAANRSRSYGHLRTMADSGIMNYVFTAVQDEHTTEICRQLDGTVFPVDVGLRRFGDLAVESKGDYTAAETLMPFVKESRTPEGTIAMYVDHPSGGRTVVGEVLERGFGRSDFVPESKGLLEPSALAGLGIAMPPLHHCCRSTLLPDV